MNSWLKFSFFNEVYCLWQCIRKMEQEKFVSTILLSFACPSYCIRYDCVKERCLICLMFLWYGTMNIKMYDLRCRECQCFGLL